MKFTITREQLQEGLVAVAASVPTKTTLPVLSNILVEATENGLRLSGTDLDIAVTTTVPASVDQEGALTLPAKKLVEIVRELPSAAIRVTSSGEQRVTIECGRAKFKLLGLPREEFPAFPAVNFSGGWSCAAGDVQKLIAHVAFAASTEESRPILNGVLWELRPERMRMVATNGHRLARMDVPATGGMAKGQADLIVPPKALDQIRRLFGDKDELEIAKSENHLGFRSATTQVFTRLIEGPYPNYEQVIPRGERQERDRGQGRPHLGHPADEHRRERPDPPDPAGADQRRRASSRFRLPTWARPRRKWPSPTTGIHWRSASMPPICSRS